MENQIYTASPEMQSELRAVFLGERVITAGGGGGGAHDARDAGNNIVGHGQMVVLVVMTAAPGGRGRM